MITVSVIVPVYNAEKYLSKCIESLLNQTLESCEFIFVNDGSSDNSQLILENYKKKDNRIILIHQENKGVSAARNAGIQVAQGEFLGFVDADDFVEKEMYQKLYSAITTFETDLVSCDFFIINSKNKRTNKFPFPYYSKLDKHYINQYIIPCFINESILNACWNKIYKASKIKSIHFPGGMPIGEDGIFNLRFFSTIQSCLFIDFVGYNYFENEGSATKNLIKNDYFKLSLERYDFSFQPYISFKIDEKKLKYWKSKRLIDSVITYCFLYLTTEYKLSFFNKLLYVKEMITNKKVQYVIHLHYEELIKDKTRFERFILKSIKEKSIIKIFLACKYSQLKNK